MSATHVTEVTDSELIAHYITEEEAIVFNEGQLKGDIFIPSPNKQRQNRLETSVIRFGDRNLMQMRVAGKQWATNVGKSFIGLARWVAKDIRKIKSLNIEHTPRKWEGLHSDIVDWDTVRYRVQAKLLAREASFIRD